MKGLKITAKDYTSRVNFFEGRDVLRSIEETEVNPDLISKVSVPITNMSDLEFNPPVWASDLLNLLQDASELNLISNGIIHGSYGDNTFTNYSDLELTLIVEENLFLDRTQRKMYQNWLFKKLYPLILKIDPLQHHGVFYLWDSLIKNYNEDVLPLSAYNLCWGLKSELLNFTVRKNKTADPKSKLLVTIQSLKNHQTTFFKYGITPFALKRFLSNITLVPAFILQLKGEMISKTDSLKFFKREGPEEIKKVLEIATIFRKEWPKPPSIIGRMRGAISPRNIPNGRIDLSIVNLYREKTLEKECERLLLPLMDEFCSTIENKYLKNGFL